MWRRHVQSKAQGTLKLVAHQAAEDVSHDNPEVVEKGRERVVDAPELHTSARGSSLEFLDLAVVRLYPPTTAVELRCDIWLESDVADEDIRLQSFLCFSSDEDELDLHTVTAVLH